MKSLLLFLFLFFFVVSCIDGQSTPVNDRLFLKDGSILSGQLIHKDEGQLRILLGEGTEILLPESSLLRIKKERSKYLMLSDSRKIKTQGFYSTMSLQVLSANRSTTEEKELRWGFGGQLSAGYQLFPILGLGLGGGVDANEYVFAPVFFEINSNLIRSRSLASSKVHQQRWKRVLPFYANLQFGYNLPLHQWLNKEENTERVKGGTLIYPAVGIMLPSYSGNHFRIDIGYKFQNFKRVWEYEWRPGYMITDKVTLKSFSVRTSIMF